MGKPSLFSNKAYSHGYSTSIYLKHGSIYIYIYIYIYVCYFEIYEVSFVTLEVNYKQFSLIYLPSSKILEGLA